MCPKRTKDRVYIDEDKIDIKKKGVCACLYWYKIKKLNNVRYFLFFFHF